MPDGLHGAEQTNECFGFHAVYLTTDCNLRVNTSYAGVCNMLLMTLSQRIAKAIGELPVKHVAKELKISHSTVYPWLTGDTKSLKMENLFALADLTGYSAKWLAIEEGPEKLLSQNSDIDLSFLTTVLQEVERFLDKERRTLDAEKKAKLITLLYEMHVGRGKVEPPAISRGLRLVV